MLIVLVGEERVSQIIHLIFSLFCPFVLLQIKILFPVSKFQCNLLEKCVCVY